MRYPKEHKQKTRERILEAAARVFRRQGYGGGGVDAIMEEAGLTAGGFYSHFASKQELFEQVVAREVRRTARQRTRGLGELDGLEWVAGFVRRYLSPRHASNVEGGCPIPPLVSEIGRADASTRGVFSRTVSELTDTIVNRLDALPESEREEAALGIVSTLVGGVVLARSVEPRLAEKVLRSAAKRALSGLPPAPPSNERNRERNRGVDR